MRIRSFILSAAAVAGVTGALAAYNQPVAISLITGLGTGVATALGQAANSAAGIVTGLGLGTNVQTALGQTANSASGIVTGGGLGSGVQTALGQATNSATGVVTGGGLGTGVATALGITANTSGGFATYPVSVGSVPITSITGLGTGWLSPLQAALGTNWGTAIGASLGANWTSALGSALGSGVATALGQATNSATGIVTGSGLGTGVQTALALATNANGGMLLAGASGFLPCGAFPALTGNITTTAGGCATTIGSNVVTYAMMATSGANTLTGNSSGSTGNKADVTVPGCTTTALEWTSGTGFSCPTSFSVSVVKGVSTNSNAASGFLGEYKSSDVPSGSQVSLTTATAADITTLSLTAGDWDCWGNVVFAAGTSPTVFTAWISQSSATMPGALENGGALAQNYPGANGTTVLPVGMARESLSGTTTVYLSGQVTGTGSWKGYGYIGCRRVQ